MAKGRRVSGEMCRALHGEQENGKRREKNCATRPKEDTSHGLQKNAMGRQWREVCAPRPFSRNRANYLHVSCIFLHARVDTMQDGACKPNYARANAFLFGHAEANYKLWSPPLVVCCPASARLLPPPRCSAPLDRRLARSLVPLFHCSFRDDVTNRIAVGASQRRVSRARSRAPLEAHAGLASPRPPPFTSPTAQPTRSAARGAPRRVSPKGAF